MAGRLPYVIYYWLEGQRLRHRTIPAPTAWGADLREFVESQRGPGESAVVWDWPYWGDVYIHYLTDDFAADWYARIDPQRGGLKETLLLAVEYQSAALHLKELDGCITLYQEYTWTRMSR